MPNKAAVKKKRRGRPVFMDESTTTTINVEKKLLDLVRQKAYALKQSVSQWVSQAAEEKLARSK